MNEKETTTITISLLEYSTLVAENAKLKEKLRIVKVFNETLEEYRGRKDDREKQNRGATISRDGFESFNGFSFDRGYGK